MNLLAHVPDEAFFFLTPKPEAVKEYEETGLITKAVTEVMCN